MSNIYTGKTAMEAINDISTSDDFPKDNNIENNIDSKTQNKGIRLTQSKEPPLGPTPIYVFHNIMKEQRILELKDAIQRYLKCNRQVPELVIDEYNDLVKDLPIED